MSSDEEIINDEYDNSDTDDVNFNRKVSKINKGTRKRQKKSSAREIKKIQRYSDPLGDSFEWPNPNCKHPSNSLYLCTQVTFDDVILFRQKLFQSKNKIEQDKFLLLYIKSADVKRHRIDDNDSVRKRVQATCFYFPQSNPNKKLRVCRNIFQRIIKPIGYNRVTGISKRFFESHSLPRENRGGDRISSKNIQRRNAVRNYINQLRGRESHYGRNKSIRVYLPSELKSIRNLHKIFNSSCDESLKTSYAMFYNIFVNEFNIGFNSPRTDVCTTCENFKYQLKSSKTNVDSNTIKENLKIHKLRAKEFYKVIDKFKHESNTHVSVFDLQQVQILPKIPIQEAFYSRQLGFYNFAVCDETCNKNYIFTWTENQSERGSNEISSAVYHYLQNILSSETDFSTIKTIVFACDGCGGQNKNNIVLSMLQSWLFGAPKHIEKILIIYPVRGHSFLPCDRLFGRISRDIQKKDTILIPQEYHEISRAHAETLILPVDWRIHDWKLRYSTLYKPLSSIQKSKCILINKSYINRKKCITVSNYENYKFNQQITSQMLLKKKRLHTSSKPNMTQISRPINVLKLRDIENLLKKTFGDNYEDYMEYNFYRNLQTSATAEIDNEVNEECDCGELEEN